MPPSKRAVKNWMRSNTGDAIEGGELNCTILAEQAAQYFDAYGPPPKYDVPEEFFEWSFEVSEEFGG